MAAHLGVLLPGQADLHLVEGRHAVGEELVVDVLVDEHPRAGAAHLPLVEQDADLHAFDGLLPGGIGEEDVGGLAAQLQGRGDQLLGRRFGDGVAHLGGAGEAQLAEARVLEHVVAGAEPRPVMTLTTPGGRTSAMSLASSSRLREVVDDGLITTRVAGGQRRGDLPGSHQEREVPGDDLADHADRLAQDEAQGVLVDHHRLPFLGPDGAGEVAEMVGARAAHRWPGSPGWACRCPGSRPWRVFRRWHRSGRRSSGACGSVPGDSRSSRSRRPSRRPVTAGRRPPCPRRRRWPATPRWTGCRP